ncbi:hypothetical protein AOQ84DRAFT_73570 [Glonium stellatum]|uniref:Uncharacterized protein n=1 Tax=Glonium stellatum TaxID=574774 RepID=A0A8E2JRC1_9PEZI|nr:hypothetical protein AOQ84DRAFT_73570 [Glonium stellatum]
MPSILILSLYGFSFSSRQLYQSLLPKLLSKANVHESITIEDAQNYISTTWPSIILVTDPAITFEEEENRSFLESLVRWTKNGGKTILMGFFAATVQFPSLDTMFNDYFGLPWTASSYGSNDAFLVKNLNGLRSKSLSSTFYNKAVWLGNVAVEHAVYISKAPLTPAYAAYAPVGFGWLGYIGDVNFAEEPENLILAMCHLDDDVET